MSKMTKEQINNYLLQYLKDNSKNYNDTIQELSDTIRSYYDKLEQQKKEQERIVMNARKGLAYAMGEYLETLSGTEMSDDEYKKVIKETYDAIKSIEPDIKKLFNLSKTIEKGAGTDDEILRKFFGGLK